MSEDQRREDKGVEAREEDAYDAIFGSPKSEGVKYVVDRLVNITENLADTVHYLKNAEMRRAIREDAAAKSWARVRSISMWILTPSIVIPFIRLIYVTIVPIFNAHGAHLPYLESGIKTVR